jgi:hypothetical protein
MIIAATAFNSFAQLPQKMSYQAVLRDNSGELLTNKSIGIRTSILRGSDIQIIVFQEIYATNPVTNENGLLTLEIGSGNASIGEFSSIDWSAGPNFLRTEIDPAGGTNYTISGQSQILSVPYALYAEKAGSFTETDPLWTVASGNYYTKTNLQTGGQASVHWDNLTSVDADVEDLASDGILTGSKIGTGISADNITAGTLPLARLSGITSSQLSATAGITSGQITSLAASKVTGISPNFIPRSNGTALVNGSITDDGTNVGVGSLFPEAKLHVRNYAGPQLMIGSSNQPAYEWYFTINPSADLSLLNENAGSPFSALYIDLTGGGGNVGIGTSTPSTKLEVNGQVKITGGTPASGQVLTSNATGLATWEPVPVPAVNQVYFEVKLTESYDWPTDATVQKIDFSSSGSVWENQGNAFNTSTSTFTAPEDGIYSFTGAIHFKSISAGDLIYAFLRAGNKNYNSSWKLSSGSVEIVCINMTLFLAAGETAQLWGYVNDSAPPASVSGNSTDNYAFTYFSGAKVH